MKRNLLILLSVISMAVVAQSKFGYVSYMEIVKALPEYNIVEAHLDELQAKYEAEIVRSDREFNQKYADFIEEQSLFPDNIRMKRHKELQELYGRMQQYYQQSQAELQQASQEKMAMLSEKISKAIKEVGVAGGYLYIFDTSSGIPYISETLSTDVTGAVKAKLGIQ